MWNIAHINHFCTPRFKLLTKFYNNIPQPLVGHLIIMDKSSAYDAKGPGFPDVNLFVYLVFIYVTV